MVTQKQLAPNFTYINIFNTNYPLNNTSSLKKVGANLKKKVCIATGHYLNCIKIYYKHCSIAGKSPCKVHTCLLF